MRVGINYPWMNYGWDFGEPPIKDNGAPWGPRAAWRATIDSELRGFRALGLFALRWFILADGMAWGIGDRQPRKDDGILGAWHFEPPGPLSPAFVEDFSFLLACCRSAGMLLLPSLIDFRFCQAGLPVEGTSACVKQGRGEVLLHAEKRHAFLDQVLRPLLAASHPFRDVIYAWELMNEPEWCTESDDSLIDAWNPRRIIPQQDMLAFLREGVGLINGAGFVSSVGFNRHATLRAWDSPGLGVTLHQFHYYASTPELPRHTFDPRWPCIVGEFASAPHRPWPELGDAQDVFSRLCLIAEHGYPAAFLWSARTMPDPPPNAVAWNDATRGDVQRYLGNPPDRLA